MTDKVQNMTSNKGNKIANQYTPIMEVYFKVTIVP